MHQLRERVRIGADSLLDVDAEPSAAPAAAGPAVAEQNKQQWHHHGWKPRPNPGKPISTSEAYAEGQMLAVETTLEILHVWAVDVKLGSFNVEVKVQARWECPESQRNKSLAEGSSPLIVDWQPEWMPLFSITNTTQKLVEWPSRFRCYSASDGRVMVHAEYRFAVTVYEHFDMRAFPFEVQDLNIRLQLDNGTELMCENSGGSTGVLVSGIELSEFRALKGMECVYGLHRCKRRRTKELHVIIFLERYGSYHIWNWLLLLWAITTSSLATWAVHWREISGRLGLDITLLLVATTFKQVLSGETGQVSYLTLLDVYAAISIVLLFLAVFLHASIGYLIVDCDVISGDCTFLAVTDIVTPRAYNLDTATFIVQGALYTVLHLVYGIHVMRKIRMVRSFLTPERVAMNGYRRAHVVRNPAPWYRQQKDEQGFLMRFSMADSSALAGQVGQLVRNATSKRLISTHRSRPEPASGEFPAA